MLPVLGTYRAEILWPSPSTAADALIDGIQSSNSHGEMATWPSNEFLDRVTLASGLVISNQSIGVATSSEGFDGVDGILGIGPVALTQGTLSPSTSTVIM
ncbi:hypothetical protein C8R43DRAFT_1116470 [Mycena crocata]|nr:hypothetical protein C8R43DRAFT_1116470 [Mycena crocata]